MKNFINKEACSSLTIQLLGVEFAFQINKTTLVWKLSSNNIFSTNYVMKRISSDERRVLKRIKQLKKEGRLGLKCNDMFLMAAIDGHYSVIEILLEYPAVQDKVADLNNYALRWAATNGHLAIVNKLLEYPVVRDKIAVRDNYALRYSAENGHLAIVTKLLEYPEVQSKIAANYNEALRWAAQNGHLEIVSRLLEYPAVQAKVTARNNHALNWAAGNGHLAIVNKLLEYSAVRAKIAADDNYALRWSAEKGHLAIVVKLLEIYAEKGAILPSCNETSLTINKAVISITNRFNSVKNDLSNWLCYKFSLPSNIPNIIFQYNNHLTFNDNSILLLVNGFVNKSPKYIYRDIRQIITNYYDPLGWCGKRQDFLYDKSAFKGFLGQAIPRHTTS